MIDDKWYLPEMYDDVDRRGSGKDFECIVECPPVAKPDFQRGSVDYEAGPRMRIVIEGSRQLVERVLAIAGPEVEAVIASLKDKP